MEQKPGLTKALETQQNLEALTRVSLRLWEQRGDFGPRKVLIKPTLAPAKASARYRQGRACSRTVASLIIYKIHCFKSHSVASLGFLLLLFSDYFCQKVIYGAKLVRGSHTSCWETFSEVGCRQDFHSPKLWHSSLDRKENVVLCSLWQGMPSRSWFTGDTGGAGRKFPIFCSSAAAKRVSGSTKGFKRNLALFLVPKKRGVGNRFAF